MTIEKDLNAFLDTHKQMIHAFDKLKVLVKEEGSKVIHEHIRVDDFDSASSVVGKLNEFSHVKLETNIEEVTEFVKNVFGEITQNRPNGESIAAVSAAVEAAVSPTGLTSAEEEALKLIGYSGTSRVQDSKGKLTESVISSLSAKGFLNAANLTLGTNNFSTFELTENGREKFKEMFNVDANDSHKKELINKYSDLTRGYFLLDAEAALEKRGYTVHNVSDELVEASKNNMYVYLTPDFGDYEEKDYFAILEKQNKLKNLGFISVNQETIDNKAKKALRNWANSNQSKLKFLSVNFTTMNDLLSTDKDFDTMTF